MARLVHATIGSVELPGANWLRELGESQAVVDGVAGQVQSPVDPDTARGPTGRWPDDVPAYDTPADVILTSITQLPSAISSASAGQVIQVPGGSHTISDAHLTLTSGPTSGPRVLVRPPLGQRANFMVSQAGGRRIQLLDARRVFLAGWNLNNIEVRADNGANNVGMGWCTWHGSARSVWRGVTSIDMWEMVCPQMTTYQGSALHLFRNSGAITSSNIWLVGWWHAGMWREAGQSNQAKDTIQTFHLDGGKITDLHIDRCVLFASSDKMMQNHQGEIERLTFTNTWMNRPEDPYWEPPPGYTTHGSVGSVAVQEPGLDVTIDGCTILGSVSNPNATGTKQNSICRGGSAWNALTDLGGNQTLANANIASHPPPPLPDLSTIWHP